MKFQKQFLLDVLDKCNSEAELIENEISERSRWSIHYSVVFKYQDKFYLTIYSAGATEHQDESPFEYSEDEIECTEVFPYKVTKTEYLTQKEIEKYETQNRQRNQS